MCVCTNVPTEPKAGQKIQETHPEIELPDSEQAHFGYASKMSLSVLVEANHSELEFYFSTGLAECRLWRNLSSELS